MANHPSFVSVPSEIEAVDRPTLIQVGDKDAMFSEDQIKQSQDIFKGQKDCEVVVFPGAVHGFSVRSDQNKEEEKKWKDQAAERAIKFLQKHLA